MKCVICQKGETKQGHTTVVLERDQTTLVFREVPVDICENCGEEYVSAETNRRLIQMANEALKRGVTLEMVKFAA